MLYMLQYFTVKTWAAGGEDQSHDFLPWQFTIRSCWREGGTCSMATWAAHKITLQMLFVVLMHGHMEKF